MNFRAIDPADPKPATRVDATALKNGKIVAAASLAQPTRPSTSTPDGSAAGRSP